MQFLCKGSSRTDHSGKVNTYSEHTNDVQHEVQKTQVILTLQQLIKYINFLIMAFQTRQKFKKLVYSNADQMFYLQHVTVDENTGKIIYPNTEIF
jgi:hypothetical protein